jgi:hypothetical protein
VHVHEPQSLTVHYELSCTVHDNRDSGFVAAMLQHLKPHLYEAGGSVYDTGRLSQGIYFVIRGVAEAYTPCEDDVSDSPK